MTTYTLNTGDIVTAKESDWPKQYANRTQAQKAASKIPGAEVIQRGRPFYVRVGIDRPREQADSAKALLHAYNAF